MAEHLNEFEWQVPRDGYNWTPARAIVDRLVQKRRERFLTPGFTTHWRRTRPLHDAAALFRTFADLETTESEVLAFANKHGALGRDEDIIDDGNKGSRGERLSTWQEEILYMHHAVRVWVAVRQPRADDLRRWFVLESGRHVAGLTEVKYRPEEPWPRGVPQMGVQFLEGGDGDIARFLFAHQGRGTPTLHLSAPSDITGAALAWLQAVINHRLQQETAAHLLGVDKPRGIPLGIRLVPNGLLGALWLQLARAIDGDKIQRRCPGCQEWFQVSVEAGGKRADAQCCSNTCRMRAYRLRATARKASDGSSRRRVKSQKTARS